MADRDIAVVREGLERMLATGEIAWETIDERIEVEDHDIPEGGVYRGHEGFGRWLEEWSEPWSEWSLEPERYIDAGEGAVIAIVHTKATGRVSGVEVDRRDALVYRLRGEKVVRLDYFNDTREAFESIGLDAEA